MRRMLARIVTPGLCLAPARTRGPERVFDLFASVFQMRLALVLPALSFEWDVSGCSTNPLLDRALQPLNLVPGLIGPTHGQSSSVVVSHGDYPVSSSDNPLDRSVELGRREVTPFEVLGLSAGICG